MTRYRLSVPTVYGRAQRDERFYETCVCGMFVRQCSGALGGAAAVTLLPQQFDCCCEMLFAAAAREAEPSMKGALCSQGVCVDQCNPPFHQSHPAAIPSLTHLSPARRRHSAPEPRGPPTDKNGCWVRSFIAPLCSPNHCAPQ